ncbi:MAG TPA: hypothetical protein VJV78_39310 [Polyangiales bacterium]|nr:hypothetical protein [Polyangiales bacterium]
MQIDRWCYSMLMCCALFGCESTHEIGSECPDDICPRALGRAEPACLVRESSNILYLTPDPDTDPITSDVCVFTTHQPGDLADCRVYVGFDRGVTLPNGKPVQSCSDVPGLDDADVTLRSAGDVALVCQARRATGEPDSEGFYYVDDYRGFPPGTQCVRFTSGIPIQAGVTISPFCAGAQTLARDGRLTETDPGVCSLPEDSAAHAEDVGRACTPTSRPNRGFGESLAYVETGSRDCATGACLIYQLFSENPTKEDIAQRRYCSCRCDAPGGDPGDLCACKPGFSCVPTLAEGPPGVRGSYCVKTGTVSLE